MAAFSAVVAFACDNKGPSESVGTCNTDSTKHSCSDYTGSTSCSQSNLTGPAFQINQDFPTDCITVTNSLCNTPSEHCRIAVSCQYSFGTCSAVPGSDAGKTWFDAPKRTAKACKG